MALTRFDDYVKGRAGRDPEFARLRRETAIGLLDGNDEDRRIARRILRDQLGLSEAEIGELEGKETTA